MKIIFSDLDGTLLDHDTYSFEQAKNAIDQLHKNHIPLVICTSKTGAEIKYWRKKIGNNHPFISENGGGIFIPKDYFSFDFLHHKKSKNYYVIELGINYDILSSTLDDLKKKYDIQSFDDMTENEVSEDANLPLTLSRYAKQRDYDIPFKIVDTSQKDSILHEIEYRNFHYTTGGRYYHIMGDNDKGEAVRILSYLFKKRYDEDIITIGIGDSENDFSMLDTVDKGYLVMKKDGTYASSQYIKAEGIGPAGWNNVIEMELKS